MSEQTERSGLRLINPPGLYDPSPNGYSHVALLPAGARLAFIAGQGGETADGSLSADFRQQVRQALRNLCVAIEAAGGSPAGICTAASSSAASANSSSQRACKGVFFSLPLFSAHSNSTANSRGKVSNHNMVRSASVTGLGAPAARRGRIVHLRRLSAPGRATACAAGAGCVSR